MLLWKHAAFMCAANNKEHSVQMFLKSSATIRKSWLFVKQEANHSSGFQYICSFVYPRFSWNPIQDFIVMWKYHLLNRAQAESDLIPDTPSRSKKRYAAFGPARQTNVNRSKQEVKQLWSCLTSCLLRLKPGIHSCIRKTLTVSHEISSRPIGKGSLWTSTLIKLEI